MTATASNLSYGCLEYGTGLGPDQAVEFQKRSSRFDAVREIGVHVFCEELVRVVLRLPDFHASPAGFRRRGEMGDEPFRFPDGLLQLLEHDVVARLILTRDFRRHQHCHVSSSSALNVALAFRSVDHGPRPVTCKNTHTGCARMHEWTGIRCRCFWQWLGRAGSR